MAEPPSREAFVRAIEEAFRSMVDSMVSTVEQTSPLAASMSPDELSRAIEDIAGQVRRAVMGAPVTEADLLAFRALWSQWVLCGVDERELLDGFEHALRAVFQQISAVAVQFRFGTIREQARLTDQVALGLLTVQSAMTRAAWAGAADSRVEAVDPGSFETVELVARLIGAHDGAQVHSLPRGAAVDDRLPTGVLALLPSRGIPQRLRDLAHSLGAANVHEGPTVYDPVPHVVLLAQVPSPDEWWPTVDEAASTVAAAGGARLVVSPTAGPLANVRHVYRRCARNLALARLVPEGVALVDPGALQLWRTLLESPAIERADLFESFLGAVVDAQRADLLQLLDALVAAGSQDAAADALGVDRRTVSRQLGQVEDLTGYRWSDHRHRPYLLVAVLCRWLAAATPAMYDAGAYGPPPNLHVMDALAVRRHG